MTASFRGFSAILRDLSAADPKNKMRYGGTLTDRKGDAGDGRGRGEGGGESAVVAVCLCVFNVVCNCFSRS